MQPNDDFVADEDFVPDAPAPARAAPPPNPEAGANPIAAWARRHLGVDPAARFSFSNVGNALTEGQPLIPDNKPHGLAPGQQLPPRDKLREDAGPFADDWLAQGIVGTAMGSAAGRVVGPVLGKVMGGAAQPIARAGTAAIEGGVGSKTQGGSATAGGAIGAGLSLLGPLGRAITQTRGGMARQLIEEHGGDVGLTTPGSGKPFDRMVTQGTTDADIGMQAKTSAEKGLGMLGQERTAVLRTLGARIGKIDRSLAGRTEREISDLVPMLQDALGDVGIADSTEAQLTKALSKIRAKQKPGFNPDTDPWMLSESDLNKTRRRLDRAARTGQAVDEKLSPLKQAANETRAMVDEGPYKEANADYARESTNYQKSRRLLGINERPRTPQETQAAVEKVTNLITRRGQNTVTAGKGLAGEEANLRAFEEKHPDIGEELVKPALLRAKGDLEFGLLPRKHGGLIDRTSSAIGAGAGLDMIASQLGHGSPKLVLPSILSYLALRNLPAVEGRLLYRPAQLAAEGEQALNNLSPLFTAARAAQGDRK